MKVGITLPQFSDDPAAALEAARRAERAGLDGVFCFDHLWPMGQPGRPALSPGPLLGALAASTTAISVGTLVARIGLLPDDVLVATLASVDRISGGRLIAGLGTGDHLSRAENEAFGVPFDPARIRRTRLGGVAGALGDLGVPVWVGGGQAPTVEVARAAGAAVNLWDADPDSVASLVASGLEVTWGGPVAGDAAAIAGRLGAVAAAGATWAVCGWPESIETVAEASGALAGGR
ncbi:MAG: LLM class flavin-dependent oxidoreductase [Actinomycetota bacterium]|nr:LLM class flavin-dependent oxidoreductase [Actinomycetota bacterium]